MGIIRKLFKWILFILGALLLTVATAIIANTPFWISALFFIVYLAIIVFVDHFIRKKIYQRRTGFIANASAIKVQQDDLYSTYLKTLHTVSRGNNSALKKQFFRDPWVIYFEIDNQNISQAVAPYEVLPEDNTEPRSATGARWFRLDKLVLIKPNQALLDGSGYNDNWRKFLVAIKNKRMPHAAIDKIVLSLSIKTLLGAPSSTVQRYLESFKTRVLQMVDATGYDVPVFIVLSDLEALSGYAAFASSLTAIEKQQVFGVDSRSVLSDFSAVAFDALANQLDTFIDKMLYERSQANALIGYEFSRQLRDLQKGWQPIQQLLFDQHLPNPILNGIFLLGKEASATTEPVQYWFAHDLVNTIFITPTFPAVITHQEMQRRARYDQIKLFAIGAAVLLVILYIVAAFASTSRNLVTLLKALPAQSQYSSDFQQNLITMTEYNNLMTDILSFRHRWTVAIFPGDAGLDRLGKLYAQRYVTQFEQNVMAPLDTTLHTFLRQHYKTLTPLQRGYLVQNLVARVNVIQAKLNQQPYHYIEQIRAPELSSAIFSETAAFENFGQLYKTYVIWQTNTSLLRAQRAKLTGWLMQFKLVTIGSANMRWLVDWANTQSDLPPVTLSDFWQGGKDLDNVVYVAPAFTRPGRQAIETFITEINNAVPSDISLSTEEKNFYEWYNDQQLSAWHDFALNFNQGVNTLNYKTQWDYLYNPNVILSVNGPYYHLLDIMHEQFATLAKNNPTIWLAQLNHFYVLLNYQVKKNKLENARNITAVTRRFLDQITQKPSDRSDQSSIGNVYKTNFDRDLKAAQAFVDYQMNLNTMYTQAVTSPGQVFGVASAVYQTTTGKVGAQSQSLINAYNQFNTMRQQLSLTADQDSVFWLLLRGPLDFYIDYINRYGSCYLQQQWVSEVLTPTNGLVGDELVDTLFGKTGLTWKFLDKYASSFLEINSGLFVPQLMLGHIFPFSDDFYNFVNSGITIQSINREQTQFESNFNRNGSRILTIASGATNVNSDANLLPYKTVLTSVCNNQTINIENFNFPAQQTINWSLGQCGPAQVSIYFNGFTLVKDYPGKFGLARFLTDFSNGAKTFQASDFPSSQAVLQSYRVQTITVNYQVSGLSDILYQLQQFFSLYDRLLGNQQRYAMSGAVPGNITLCWKNSVMQKIYTQESNNIALTLPQSNKPSVEAKGKPVAKEIASTLPQDKKLLSLAHKGVGSLKL